MSKNRKSLNPTKPLNRLSYEELTLYIGKKVRKASGKPFSDGNKIAIVKDIIVNPFAPHLAFTFEGDAKLCSAGQCLEVKTKAELFESQKSLSEAHPCPAPEEHGIVYQFEGRLFIVSRAENGHYFYINIFDTQEVYDEEPDGRGPPLCWGYVADKDSGKPREHQSS